MTCRINCRKVDLEQPRVHSLITVIFPLFYQQRRQTYQKRQKVKIDH